MKKRYYLIVAVVVSIVLLGLITYVYEQDQGNFAYADRFTIGENGIYDIFYEISVNQLSIAGISINGERKVGCQGSTNYLIKDQCRLLLLKGDKIGIWHIEPEYDAREPRYSLQIIQVNLNGVDSPKQRVKSIP